MTQRLGCLVVLFAIWGLFLLVNPTHSAVIGIDLGADFYKVSLIHGSYFDLVLNPGSQRKTAAFVGFTEGADEQRLFGDNAKRLTTRSPARVFSDLFPLLGKSASHPLLNKLGPHLPFKIETDFSRNSVMLPVSIPSVNISAVTPEEVIAMMLSQASSIAAAHLNQKGLIADVVLIVPAYFTQIERLALLDAADLAGLNVLAFITEGAAAALNYGLMGDVTSLEEGKNQRVLFYDIGASSTESTLVKFQKTKDLKSNKSVLRADIEAAGWDRTLGGRRIDERLASHYLDQAAKSGYPQAKTEPRAQAKMLLESRALKHVLSANQEARISVEGLLYDFNFRDTGSRVLLDTLCGDLFEEIGNPLKSTLKAAQVGVEDVAAYEMLGGTSRVPAVRKSLQKVVNRDHLDGHIDAEESPVLGAVVKAASLSSGIRVQSTVELRDFLPRPIEFVIEALDSDTKENKEESSSQDSDDETDDKIPEILRLGTYLPYKGILFNQSQSIVVPKRVVTIRVDKNVRVTLRYTKVEGDELDFENDDVLSPSRTLATYEVEGIPEADKLNKKGQNLQKGLTRTHLAFALSSTGLVELVNVESEIKEPTPVKSSFSSSSSSSSSTSASSSSSKSENSDTKNDSNAPPKTRMTRRLLKLDFKELPRHQSGWQRLKSKPLHWAAAKARLTSLDRRDKERREKEETRNKLEQYVFAELDKLSDEEHPLREVTTQEQRDAFQESLQETSLWLEEEAGPLTPTSTYREKLSKLENLGHDIAFRVSEKERRPKAVVDLKAALADAERVETNTTFIKEMFSQYPEEADVQLEKARKILKASETARNWLAEKETEQKAKSAFEKPAFSSAETEARTSLLRTQVTSFTSGLVKALMSASKSVSRSISFSASASASASSSASSSASASMSAAYSDVEPQPDVLEDTHDIL